MPDQEFSRSILRKDFWEILGIFEKLVTDQIAYSILSIFLLQLAYHLSVIKVEDKLFLFFLLILERFYSKT